MYHCHIQFYLTGQTCRVFEIIKEMSPLAHFSHDFMESDRTEASLASEADVILVNLQELDVRAALSVILSGKKPGSELLILAGNEQMDFFADGMAEAKDIWLMPMSDAQIRFRFLRWQENYKLGKDFWQADHFLDATINNVPNLIWYKTKDGIHEKVNDSFCRTVNKTKDDVQGRGHAYIWNVEQDDPVCIESEREVMDKRETCISEEHIKTGEGMRTLTTYKSPLYDIDGSVMGTVGVAVDITQEREYQQEIIRKEHTLERIFTTIDCGVIRHTLDGTRVLSINAAALKILGYESREKLEADGFQMIADSVVDEDKEKLRECITTLTSEGDSVSVEYRVRHKDGEVLHVMGNVKLLRDNGELVYQRFLLDCTAQKQQEKKNRRHQAELIQALGLDYTLICYFDLANGMGMTLRKADTADEMLDEIFGSEISLEKSMERYIQECVFDEDREMMLHVSESDNLKAQIVKRNPYYVNFRVAVNDEVEYFQMKVVRAGEWGENCGIVLGFRSIDDEIRYEREQKKLLEDALAQANRANEAKSTFLSNMSHDIRTPMNAIVGFTNLAIVHMDNQEQVEEYLKKIKTSGDHLLNLINDILDMSRIESGKIQLEEKPCNLGDVVNSLYNILLADVQKKNQDLRFDMTGVANENIYCDKLRLNQVLLNLVSNSVKYTKEGGSISLIVTQRGGAPRGYGIYEFHIKDTGMGMSAEFLERIFEPFERENNMTVSKIQGTGLGMAITKNIVDMMEGTISVWSKQGIGTEFTVCFTFRQQAGSEDNTQKKNEWNPVTGSIQEQPREEKISEKLQRGCILLAEDVELNQEIATVILNDAGFSVEIAENGKVAVEMLTNSQPGYYQLILMDVQMPIMNGYDATKEIRALENQELASIPIIAMTANAFEEDRQEALKSGMNAHIAKPIEIERLLSIMEKVLV